MNYNAIYKRNLRITNPEFYEKEQNKIKIYLKHKYDTDPEYKLKRQQQARDYYHRMKSLKSTS